MTINDLTNKEEYKKFKLVGAEYDQNKNETVITFLYSDFNKPTDEEKKKLKMETLTILGSLTNNSVKFKKSYIDDDLVYAMLNEYISSFPYLKGAIKKGDIHTNMTKQPQKEKRILFKR